MKLTRQVIAGVLIVGFLVMFLAVPQSAEAGGRSPGPFFGGLAVGAVTGLVVGSIFAPRVYAAPPPVVYQPAPVVVYQPAPVCSNYWVQPQWTGYQWVPGYWAQVCR